MDTSLGLSRPEGVTELSAICFLSLRCSPHAATISYPARSAAPSFGREAPSRGGEGEYLKNCSYYPLVNPFNSVIDWLSLLMK